MFKSVCWSVNPAPAAVVAVALSGVVNAQCEPSWLPAGVTPDFAGGPSALIAWCTDEGNRDVPLLVAGGDFRRVGGVNVNRIAWFDGQTWQPMGQGFNARVNDLIEFDFDGNGPQAPQLVAAGHFTSTGGMPAPGVARWNGQAWTVVGGSVGSVEALAIWDFDGDGPLEPQLVAGGWFTGNVAKWNGVQWVGMNLGSTTYALTKWDPDGSGPQHPQLMAGTFSGVFRWTGSNWVSLNPTSVGFVQALISWDPDGNGSLPPQLIAGGSLISGMRVARWDGTAWQPLGAGPGIWIVEALESWDADADGPLLAKLIVAGQRSGNGPALVGWDGLQWYPIPTVDTAVGALTTWSPDPQSPQRTELVAGSSMVSRWDGLRWQNAGSGLRGWARSQTNWDPDGGGPLPARLVVGTDRGTLQWDGLRWQTIPLGGSPNALITWRPPGELTSVLIAGGANGLQSWNGIAWNQIGFGTITQVFALAVWDPDDGGPRSDQLVVAGSFTNDDGGLANRIATWDGARWAPLGAGINDAAGALAVWDPDGPGPLRTSLVAAGSFSLAGGGVAQGVARWDGTQWNELAAGPQGIVSDLAVWDPDGAGPSPARLAAAGSFFDEYGNYLSGVGLWDGAQWQNLGLDWRFETWVQRLTVWDRDGDGPEHPSLVAGGEPRFLNFNATHVVRWDGTQWTVVGGELNDRVRTLGQWDPDGDGPLPSQLAVGGHFTVAGSVTTSYMTFAGCPASSCPADVDRDGHAGTSDVSRFLSLWHASLQYGTLDGDFDFNTVVEPADVSAFVRAWLIAQYEGC